VRRQLGNREKVLEVKSVGQVGCQLAPSKRVGKGEGDDPSGYKATHGLLERKGTKILFKLGKPSTSQAEKYFRNIYL